MDLRVTPLRSNSVNVSWSFAPPPDAPRPTGLRLEYRTTASRVQNGGDAQNNNNAGPAASSEFLPATDAGLPVTAQSAVVPVHPEREYVFRVVASYSQRGSVRPIQVNSPESAPFVYSRVPPARFPIVARTSPGPGPGPVSTPGQLPIPDSGAKQISTSAGPTRQPADPSNDEYYDEDQDAPPPDETPSSVLHSPSPVRGAVSANGGRSPSDASPKEPLSEESVGWLSLYAGVSAAVVLVLLILLIIALIVLYRRCRHKQGALLASNSPLFSSLCFYSSRL